MRGRISRYSRQANLCRSSSCRSNTAPHVAICCWGLGSGGKKGLRPPMADGRLIHVHTHTHTHTYPPLVVPMRVFMHLPPRASSRCAGWAARAGTPAPPAPALRHTQPERKRHGGRCPSITQPAIPFTPHTTQSQSTQWSPRTLAAAAVDWVREPRVVRLQVRPRIQHAVGDGVELLRVPGEPRHLGSIGVCVVLCCVVLACVGWWVGG